MLTLTLKNIPTHLHARLKESAAKNRRSLNSEILTRLEREVAAPKVDRAKLARELKAFTNQLPYVDHRIGDRYKRKGLKRSSSTPTSSITVGYAARIRRSLKRSGGRTPSGTRPFCGAQNCVAC